MSSPPPMTTDVRRLRAVFQRMGVKPWLATRLVERVQMELLQNEQQVEAARDLGEQARDDGSTTGTSFASPSSAPSSPSPSSSSPQLHPELIQAVRRAFAYCQLPWTGSAAVHPNDNDDDDDDDGDDAAATTMYPQSLPRTACDDLHTAWQLTSRTTSICLLLGGTSGSGKSTLASLLAARLGVTTVVSTDHVRGALRGVAMMQKSEMDTLRSSAVASTTTTTLGKGDPLENDHRALLFASSYEAGEVIGRIRREQGSGEETSTTNTTTSSTDNPTIDAFERQNALLVDAIDALIARCQRQRESLIVEGVHLSPMVVQQLLERHTARRAQMECTERGCTVSSGERTERDFRIPTMTIFPALLYIKNAAKHTERFAIRAKYMTLEARANRYVRYFTSIRRIQEWLCTGAAECGIPVIDNTNVDRSLVLLHQTLLEHLYRAATAARHAFLPLHLPLTAATSPYAVAFNTVTRAHLVKSKHMLVRIRAKNHRADLEQQRRRGSASAGETGDDYTAGETVDDEMEDECFETFAGTARMATTRRGDDNGDGITDGGFLRVHASSLSQSDLDVPSPSLPVSMQETLLHADQYVIRRARWSAETGGGSLES